MGNNFCYQKGGQSSNFPHLILRSQMQGCEVLLTAGNIENEDVECIVQPTDYEYSNISNKNKPTFIPQHGECIYVGGTKGIKFVIEGQKHIILSVVMEKGSLISSDKSDESKQVIYAAIQSSLKMADSKQIKSIAFPVFEQKDFTTSATIMLMAIKFCITEKKINSISRINVTLDQIDQVGSFKWVFSQVFKSGMTNLSPSKSYSSSIQSICDTLPEQNILAKQKSNYQEDTP